MRNEVTSPHSRPRIRHCPNTRHRNANIQPYDVLQDPSCGVHTLDCPISWTESLMAFQRHGPRQASSMKRVYCAKVRKAGHVGMEPRS